MTAEAFGRSIEKAIRDGGPDAQRQCERIAIEAQKNPLLLEPFSGRSHLLEYHTFRSPDCAIKVFNFNASLSKESPVHDHAGFWAVYIVYTGEMRMAFYEEDESGRKPWPGLRRLREIMMRAGDTQLISPDDLHSVWSTVPGTVALTVYNGDLNAAPRRIYDQFGKVMIRDRSQWQARQASGAYSASEGGQLRRLEDSEIVEEK